MSEKEKAAAMLDMVPAYKMGYVIAYLQGLMDDEAQDDAFCADMLKEYMEDPDPHKHDTISIEDLAAQLGVKLP